MNETHHLVARAILGLQLAHAFKHAKSKGLKFRVSKYDGVPMLYSTNDDLLRLNVDVESGVVKAVKFG